MIKAPYVAFMYFTLAEWSWKLPPFQWDRSPFNIGFEQFGWTMTVELPNRTPLPSGRLASMALKGCEDLLSLARSSRRTSSWFVPDVSFGLGEKYPYELKLGLDASGSESKPRPDGQVDDPVAVHLPQPANFPEPYPPTVIHGDTATGLLDFDPNDIIVLVSLMLMEFPYRYPAYTPVKLVLAVGGSLVRGTPDNNAYIKVEFLNDPIGAVNFEHFATSLKQVWAFYASSERYKDSISQWTIHGQTRPFTKITVAKGPPPAGDALKDLPPGANQPTPDGAAAVGHS